jgi:hypothetical protein
MERILITKTSKNMNKMNIKHIKLKIIFRFFSTCLFYSCNRADNIKVITQEGIPISTERIKGCEHTY